MTVMGIDPAGLRAAGPAVDDVAAGLREVLRSLELALDLEGTCWGRDHIGRVFAESYLPAATQARQAGGLMHDGVTAIAAAIGAVAGNADAAESRVQARLR